MVTKIYFLISAFLSISLIFFFLRKPILIGKEQGESTLKGQLKGNSSMLLPITKTGTYHLELQLISGELLLAHSSYNIATNSWVMISKKEAKTCINKSKILRIDFSIEEFSGELDKVEFINPKLFKPCNFKYTWKQEKSVAT
ncbi:hypothetical protein [Salipaludibacillus agaradhaerens]|jgi:hypothetical protein|uniref:hypothetical protein n=1 Tax=Salipaludibacillus agaradhaerens TaxID=76935 RepID=UPI00099886B2|nr:hypothetical protein [Salipaludibacillus agaradhaerens]